MNNVKAIQKINETELRLGLDSKKSWHDMYSGSAYVFIGGVNYDLTEGDILAVFSQYGEILNINLVRDKKTGKPKGFCFLCYENQKSTVLAVDNLNGIKLCGRTIRVDHVSEYRRPKDEDGNEIIEKGCAPRTPTPSPSPSDDQSEKDVASSHKEKKKSKSKKNKDKKKKKAKHTVLDSDSGTDLKGPASKRAKTSPSHLSECTDTDTLGHNPPSHTRPKYDSKRVDKPRIGDSEHSKNYRSNRSPPRQKERGRAEYIERRDCDSRYRRRSRSRSRERRDERYSRHK